MFVMYSSYINSPDRMPYDDPHPGIELNDISDLHERVKSLFSRRSKTSRAIRDNYIQVLGAVEMLDEMAYHFEKFVPHERVLTKYHEERTFDRTPETIAATRAVRCEILAYLLAVGRLRYFADSDFLKEYLVPDIPKIKYLTPFRNKYAGHRSVDFPRTGKDAETSLALFNQAMSFRNISSILGEGGSRVLIFQMIVDDPNGTITEGNDRYSSINYVPTDCHSTIMSEAYTLIENLLNVQ